MACALVVVEGGDGSLVGEILGGDLEIGYDLYSLEVSGVPLQFVSFLQL